MGIEKLYFMIRGSQTNVLFINKENNIQTFKKIDDVKLEKIKSELTKNEFVDSLSPILFLLNNTPNEDIIKNFKFIDKDIKQEIDLRTGDWKTNLIEILKEIVFKDISVFFEDKSQDLVMKPVSFVSINQKSDYIFDNYFDSLNQFFSLKYSLNKENVLRNEIEKHIDKMLEKFSKKLNELKIRIEKGCSDKEYEQKANLLLMNLSNLIKGMKEIRIKDYITGEEIVIGLDEKLSPSKNVDYYFDKAKSERISFHKSKLLYDKLKLDFSFLQKIKSDLHTIHSLDELRKIKKELNIKTTMQNKNETDNFNFRHFLIDNKYHLYVGKDSRNNDVLTLKFAKPNDYWFHARSVSGSHAVLRVDNTKEAIPKNILKKAASIAGFYSKAKNSKVAPVTYTLKKYVIKKKGMEPGKVALLKENVLLVPPEIPADCISIDES